MGEMLLRPLIVGIAGGSGSGKTTVTNELMGALGGRGALLQHDWYYRDQSSVPEPERATLNFDHPDAQETELLVAHLKELQSGLAIDAPQYDFSTHTRLRDTVRIEPRPVLVVEGINTLADPALRALMELAVFVDAPPDIRFIRRLQRDVAERGRTVECVVRQYLDQVRPMHETFVEPCREAAGLVLSGEVPPVESACRILACLGLAP